MKSGKNDRNAARDGLHPNTTVFIVAISNFGEWDLHIGTRVRGAFAAKVSARRLPFFHWKTNELDFQCDPIWLGNRLHTDITALKISASFSTQSLRRCRFAAIFFMHTQATKRWACFSLFKHWNAGVGSYLNNWIQWNFSSRPNFAQFFFLH